MIICSSCNNIVSESPGCYLLWICQRLCAPGQQAKGSDESVNTFVPGHEQESIPVPSSLCYGASQFVPGQQMKQGGITIIGPIITIKCLIFTLMR